MPTISLNDESTALSSQFDLIIVGAGAAGLTIANEFTGTTKRVCVLESGGWQRSKADDDLNDFESVGRPRTKDASIRSRGVGGTTALWTGRCGDLDQIDYAQRSWLPISGWPITYSDVVPFLAKADEILNLPPLHSASYGLRQTGSTIDQPSWNKDFFNTVAWRFSATSGARIRQFASDENSLGVLDHSGSPEATNLGQELGPRIAQSENVVLMTDATVMEVLTNEAGTTVLGVVVSTPDRKKAPLFASQVILACGGIENARLLLDSRDSNPAGLGNNHDQVGRYLTDHTFSVLGVYTGSTGAAVRRRLGTRWIKQHGQRRTAIFGLGLSADLQRREELLNAAVHIVEFGRKQSAISSIASAARILKARGNFRSAAKDLVSGLSRPLDLLSGIQDRFLRKLPQLNLPDYTLVGCVVEQELDPNSRLSLSENTNWLGQRIPILDWRFSDREYQTALRTAELFFADIARLDLPAPEPAEWIESGQDAWADSLTDLAHPMCTTRMSLDPEKGVVDENCQVHGVAGLFVAGSSVFATPSHMNPTRQIIALSLRLADHLKQAFLIDLMPAIDKGTVSAKQEGKIKVVIVGGGHRFQSIYLPVLEALRNQLEVACIVTKTAESASRIASQTGWKTVTDLSKAVADEAPDFLVVAIPSQLIDETFPQLVDLGIPLLLDTPFCWNVRSGRKLLRQIEESGLMVGVAEQFPFLPEEQLRRKVIQLGLIGSVTKVVNDFSVFDYHGISLCKAHLGLGAQPIKALGLTIDEGSNDPWLKGTIVYDDGQILVHNYASGVESKHHNFQEQVRVYGTSGTLKSGQMVFDGCKESSPVVRVTKNGCLEKIIVHTPLGEVCWSNPFSDFALDDEQIAVATIFSNMCLSARYGSAPLYGPRMALEDVELLAAMRYSANGASRWIRIPINDTVEKIRQKISKRLGLRRHTVQ